LEFFAALPLLFVTGAPQLSPRGGVAITTPLDTATALGLKLCFTPVRSPESNGIPEAFVKTFKPDYARPSILPDAETLMLPPWFEDYNEVHPHPGLKFLPPREFLRLSAWRNQLLLRSNWVHTTGRLRTLRRHQTAVRVSHWPRR
jgi:hypothetical protein